MEITNDTGRKFLIRIVRQGERYGLDDCLVHDKKTDTLTGGRDPLIEFYDLTVDLKKFGPRGQFVSRYYASTLADHSDDRGLNLYGGEPLWQVDAEALRPVLHLAREICFKK